MGCDIHVYLEKRSNQVIREEKLNQIFNNSEKTEDIWVSADKWSPDPDYPEWSKRKNHIEYQDRIYAGRNYLLFGILAGVRWWDCPNKISEPRGLPSNLSQELKEIREDWGSDGHSDSYFTLTELLNYDWSFWDDYDIGDGEKVGPELKQFMKSIDKMKLMCSDGSTDNLRIVFWFDN